MPKRKRAVVGFYKDDDGKTRPVTKPLGELKRKKVIEKPKPFKGVSPHGIEKDYGQWGLPEERIVYKDRDFLIVRYPARTKTKFCYEVIPITKEGKRLDDWQICPEPSTFPAAKRLMERYRKQVRNHKRGSLRRSLVDVDTYEYVLISDGKHVSKVHVFVNKKEKWAFIYSIRTSKGFMRKGFGGRLVDMLEADLKRRGIKEVRTHLLGRVVPMFVRRGYKSTYSGSGYYYKEKL